MVNKFHISVSQDPAKPGLVSTCPIPMYMHRLYTSQVYIIVKLANDS